MTGFSVRIQREGRWVNVDLDTLSDAELEDWTEASRSREPFAGWRWAGAARWIRDHVREDAMEPHVADRFLRRSFEETLRSLLMDHPLCIR